MMEGKSPPTESLMPGLYYKNDRSMVSFAIRTLALLQIRSVK
jgi:hypothetical protein